MKIVSIEPTPSPNSMKINLDESLPQGETRNYKEDQKDDAPDYARQLLEIEGIKGLYHVADFIALDRHPKVDWQVILPKARKVFGDQSAVQPASQNTMEAMASDDKGFGEISVFFQTFRGIPLQIKLTDGTQEVRQGLPERFMEAALKAETSSHNMVMEREWKEQGIRYGTMDEIGEEVAEEVDATYDEARLKQLISQAFEDQDASETKSQRQPVKVTLDMLDDADWKKRYAALEKMDPTLEDIPVLDKALEDEKASIRRLSTVYLGMIEKPEVLPYLYKALEDPSVTVRRTAGDCLSDIGDPDAIGAMVKALKDKNKLVRWRAAMFLYEVGDETAIPALQEAQDDPEFEVKMQVNMALERIEGGKAAEGSVWHQMTKGLSEEKNK